MVDEADGKNQVTASVKWFQIAGVALQEFNQQLVLGRKAKSA